MTEHTCILLYYLNVLWFLQSYVTVNIDIYTHTHICESIIYTDRYASICKTVDL